MSIDSSPSFTCHCSPQNLWTPTGNSGSQSSDGSPFEHLGEPKGEISGEGNIRSTFFERETTPSSGSSSASSFSSQSNSEGNQRKFSTRKISYLEPRRTPGSSSSYRCSNTYTPNPTSYGNESDDEDLDYPKKEKVRTQAHNSNFGLDKSRLHPALFDQQEYLERRALEEMAHEKKVIRKKKVPNLKKAIIPAVITTILGAATAWLRDSDLCLSENRSIGECSSFIGIFSSEPTTPISNPLAIASAILTGLSLATTIAVMSSTRNITVTQIRPPRSAFEDSK